MSNADKKSSLVQIAQAVLDETTQTIKVSGSVTTTPPPGVATEAKQDAANTKLDTLISQTDGIEGSLSSIDGKVATSIKQDTGNTSLASIDTKVSSLSVVGSGVATSALRVQLADESLSALENINVTVTNTALEITNDDGNPIPVSGTVTANAGTGSFTVAQPTAANLNASVVQSGTWDLNNISGTISLPTGAATSAKQPALGTAGTPSSDVLTVQGTASMTALKVDGSAVTQPISGTVTANAGTGSFTVVQASATNLNVTSQSIQAGNWSTRALDGAGSPIASATTTPNATDRGLVVRNIPSGTQTVSISNSPSVYPLDLNGFYFVGSNLSPSGTERGIIVRNIPSGTQNVSGTVSVNTMTYVNRVRLVYSSTNVTTTAWVELLASVGASSIKELEIFDSSGETLELGIGASGSEVSKSYVFPGGNGRIPLQIAALSRLSVKAVSATANSGELIINLYT